MSFVVGPVLANHHNWPKHQIDGKVLPGFSTNIALSAKLPLPGPWVQNRGTCRRPTQLLSASL